MIETQISFLDEMFTKMEDNNCEHTEKVIHKKRSEHVEKAIRKMRVKSNTNRMGSIYLVRNNINGQVYIGETVLSDPIGRIKQHLRDTENGSDNDFHQAIREFGWENFTLRWLHYKTIKEEDLKSIEAFYIWYHNTRDNGYNSRWLGSRKTRKRSGRIIPYSTLLRLKLKWGLITETECENLENEWVEWRDREKEAFSTYLELDGNNNFEHILEIGPVFIDDMTEMIPEYFE